MNSHPAALFLGFTAEKLCVHTGLLIETGCHALFFVFFHCAM